MMGDILLIENALVVSDPVEPGYQPGLAVLIEGGTVAAVRPAEELRAALPGAARLDAGGAWLLPGLIDAHTHLYAALTAGMPGLPHPPVNFPQVLERVWWPFDNALREEDVYLSALVGSLASLRSGITTIFDHHSSPKAAADSLSVVAAAVQQVGLRACLAFEVTDRNGPALCAAGIRENVRFLKELVERADPRLSGLFGLHAVYSLSDETLLECAELGAELQAGFHMHVAEHRTEVELFARGHAASIVEFLHSTGILGPKTVLAHTVHLDEAQIEILRQTGTFNAHNPRSNMGNGVGIAPVAKMLALGQPVGLGSDGFYDLPGEMNLAAMLATLNAGSPSAFTGQQALAMVYRHNAEIAGRLFGRRFGQVAAGYAADLILVRYQPSTPVTPENLGGHILPALCSGSVETALVGGKIVLRKGEIPDIDEDSLRRRACLAAQGLWKRYEEAVN